MSGTTTMARAAAPLRSEAETATAPRTPLDRPGTGPSSKAGQGGALSRLAARTLRGPTTMMMVQLMQSGSSLLANGLLIASIGSAAFGTFSLGQAIVLYVIGVLDAGYLTPATIRAARPAPARAERGLLGQLPAYSLAVAVLALGALAVLPWLLPHLGVAAQDRWPVIWSVVFSAVVLAFREAARVLGLSSRRWGALLLVEMIANAAWLLALLVVIKGTHVSSGNPAIPAIALYGVPGVIALGWIVWRRLQAPRVRAHLRLKALLARGRWSLAAAQITWLQSQSYIYFVAGLLSPQVLGWVAAARMLFAPLQTLSTGLMRGVLPEFAQMATSGERERFVRRVARVGLTMSCLTLVWTCAGVVLVLFYSQAFRRHGYEITVPLVLAWGCDFLFMLLRSVVYQALRAMECFRQISQQSAFGAAVSVAMIPLGIATAGAVGALLALAAAELVAMLLGIRTLRRQAYGLSKR